MAKALEIADLDHGGLELEIASLKTAFAAHADVELSLANALFISLHAQIADAVQRQLRALYDAELSRLDFSTPEAITTINSWVKSRTKGKVPEIIQQLSPLAALVALNAVYFKGSWVRPFKKELTQDKPFRTAAGAIKQVPMMLQGGHYSYYEDELAQIAVLPYRGNASMYLVLPAANTDMKKFRRELTSSLYESWMSQLRSAQGTIELPRFRVNYDSELNGALKALGMERAFDQNRAEFERLQTDQPPVWLDRVIHRAVTEVNEEGTEAAAATIAYVLAGAAMPQKPPKLFHLLADHPFFALIRNESTKTILFMGWIGDPR